MNTLPNWYERKFAFDFPTGLYVNLLVRLRGAPARLEELARACSADLLIRKPEGKWSIQENAGHLLDLEPLWLTRVADFLSGAQILSATDLGNRKTHEANHNARPIEKILAEFRQARFALLERLEPLSSDLFSRSALHPRLKTPMRLVDHLYFVAEHDDHHLARIWELARL